MAIIYLIHFRSKLSFEACQNQHFDIGTFVLENLFRFIPRKLDASRGLLSDVPTPPRPTIPLEMLSETLLDSQWAARCGGMSLSLLMLTRPTGSLIGNMHILKSGVLSFSPEMLLR